VQLKDAVYVMIKNINQAGFTKLEAGHQLVVVSRRSDDLGIAYDDQRLAARVHMVGNRPAIERPFKVRRQQPVPQQCISPPSCQHVGVKP
jgi:nitrogen-specific signal transduction histidine kinase